MSAFHPKADIIGDSQKCPLMTQSGHFSDGAFIGGERSILVPAFVFPVVFLHLLVPHVDPLFLPILEAE